MPFILAMVVTMAWLPLLVRFAPKWGIVDEPGTRKVHVAPIPRVGGLAMTMGVLIASLLAIKLQAQDRWFLLAASILVVFGALDDRFDLDYRLKLVGQIIAVGVVVVFGGIAIHSVTLDERIALPGALSVPLTILFLVGITNAVNLADGLDGLAGGTTFLCLCAVALLSSISDQGSSIALSLAFAGAVIGFLRFNTYPASVFMGDAGSQLLGFAIGVLSVRATQSISSQISAAIPALLLALPILDTLSVMVQRIGEGRSPFSADKNHIHHKLLGLGFDHHEAVMVVYSIQAVLFVVAYFLRFESDIVILGVVTSFFALAICLMQSANRSGWRLRNRAAGSSIHVAFYPARFVALRIRERLPKLAYAAIAVGIFSYAALVVMETVSLSSDFRVLIVSLLAVSVVFAAVLRGSPLSIVEKGALYVTVTVLVYIDTVFLSEERFLAGVIWIAVGLAAVGTAVQMRLYDDRRFRLTPLDLIVLFMALVVPSLPGTLQLPHGGALAIAKLVILFYAVEVLVSRADGKFVWLRLGTGSILVALAARPLLPF
jgi:UDP-GlcNAc:undecaprenyl-phosphate GlcNAc-1-phosphate transferase